MSNYTTRQEYLNAALRTTGEGERVLAIAGWCRDRADAGDFMATFDRAEYLLSDFKEMTNAGCHVQNDLTTIYVYFEDLTS